MAGALNLIHPETIGYYFEHWNSDLFSISCVLVLILIVSGYFYGCVLRKFIKPLKNVDCTFLGVFFILGVFQIFIFYALTIRMDTTPSYNLLKILILGGPFLCAATLSSPLPSWKHLASLITGILISVVLCIASAKLNTNNIFFDSVYYMSETLESSTRSRFVNVNYYLGVMSEFGNDKFHSFQGYYYFWGMLLRWARSAFDLTESMTPTYIWGASILYFMALGSLIVSSVNALFRKHKWAYVLIAIAVLSPYYTNYFNTTLAFFGNTMRTVVTGYLLLVAYLYLKSNNKLLFLPLMAMYYASIAASSTGFILSAMTSAALFFTMCFRKEAQWKNWMLFILSCLPIFHYAVILLSAQYDNYFLMTGIAVAAAAVLMAVAWCIRKRLEGFCRLGAFLFFIVLAGLIVLSFLWRNGPYEYSFYFAARSYKDMTNNFTSHVSSYELYRNLILYALLALLVVNCKAKSGKAYRTFLFIGAALFLNPLTEPAVARLITSEVYSRGFDLIVNPFTMVFLLWNARLVLKPAPVQWTVLASVAVFSFWMGKINWSDYYSKTLIFKDEGYDWRYKVGDDAWEMYDYIENNLAGDENKRPLFLSQDVSLKAYVSDIQLVFGASDYRDSLEHADLFEQNRDIVTMLYPHKLTNDLLVNDQQADYTKLSKVLLETKADYLVMRNTIAIWNDRGWYTKAYQPVLDSGQCTLEFENDTWVILKINHTYAVPEKNRTRYWVHRIETEGVQEPETTEGVNAG